MTLLRPLRQKTMRATQTRKQGHLRTATRRKMRRRKTAKRTCFRSRCAGDFHRLPPHIARMLPAFHNSARRLCTLRFCSSRTFTIVAFNPRLRGFRLNCSRSDTSSRNVATMTVSKHSSVFRVDVSHSSTRCPRTSSAAARLSLTSQPPSPMMTMTIWIIRPYMPTPLKRTDRSTIRRRNRIANFRTDTRLLRLFTAVAASPGTLTVIRVSGTCTSTRRGSSNSRRSTGGRRAITEDTVEGSAAVLSASAGCGSAWGSCKVSLACDSFSQELSSARKDRS